jgi:nucleoid DNA-binding protein
VRKLGLRGTIRCSFWNRSSQSLKRPWKRGETVKISGFGNFIVREKKPRRGRNPQTGEKIIIIARRVLTFSPSKILRKAVNQEASSSAQFGQWRRVLMKLRTFDGEEVRGEMTTAFPVSPDGSPILLVNDDPFSPEEADFFLESATSKEMKMLKEGGYDLPAWEEKNGG